MRRNSKSKKKGPASFVIGEEAIVDDAFRTEQPSGSNPTEETAEDRHALASPGGGAKPTAASRQRVQRDEVPVEAPASSSEAPAWDAVDEEEPEARGFRDAPTEDIELPPAPIARRSRRDEPKDDELLYPTREELAAEEREEELEEDVPEERPSRRREPRAPMALPSLRRGGSDGVEDDEPESSDGPRLEERERRGLAVAGVVVLLIAVIGFSGVLKGGGDEEQSAGPDRGDRLAQLQDRRAERRAERLADRRAERIAERRQERLAARRQERREAREAEQAEATPAPVETAPVAVPVPAPAPAPVAPAPAPTGDNIAGNEWGP